MTDVATDHAQGGVLPAPAVDVTNETGLPEAVLVGRRWVRVPEGLVPGRRVGEYDWIQVLRPGPDRTPPRRLLWWHIADSNNPRFHIELGDVCCGGTAANHAITAGGPDDLKKLTLDPSLISPVCGRHGWIREGRWADA